MELKLMYPFIVIIALILTALVFFVLKRYQGYRKGLIIANTKYVKNTKYYKELMAKYKIYQILINTCCIIGIILSSILTARLNYTQRFDTEVFNRDILLCMDVSQSVDKLNSQLIKELKTTVASLTNDRFGIAIFDALPVSIIPLTTDYNYVINYLERFEKAYITRNNQSYFTSFLYAGTEADGRGTSLIGEGLAYCATTFKQNDDRTKIIIFSTDNKSKGTSLVSLSDAADYAKNNNIKVYAIGTANIESANKKTLEAAATKTGGKYYDFSKFTPKEIIDEIETLNTSPIKANSYIQRVDVPELIFLYLAIVIFIMLVIDWRMKI